MKRFIIKTIIMVIPVAIVILYYSVAIEPHRNGDLGKLGFIAFDDEYDSLISRITMDSLYVINIDNLEQIDCDSAILTIGDSFSQQGGGGYQNYLATLYPGWRIYNYKPVEGVGDRYQIYIDMLIEDKPLPRIVILESVERALASRLSNMRFDNHAKSNDEIGIPEETTKGSDSEFKTFVKKSKLYQLAKCLKENKEGLKTEFLNTQEYVKKYLDIDNPVKKTKLNSRLFSCKGSEDDLFFYYEDLNDVAEDTYKRSWQKLDTLLSIIEQKGICFIYLVASDKYDLYKDFTVYDNYKVDGQLDYYEKYNNNIKFLNCKTLLYPHIKRGEKDIYKCNDTHWSPIASRYVANEIKRRIELQKKYHCSSNCIDVQ